MAKAPKKLTHTQKWKALYKIPGFKSEIRGLYHKEKSNVGKVASLYRKLKFQTKHPERFTTVRPRTKKARANLAGNPRGFRGNVVVPLLGFDTVRIDKGSLIRTRTKSAGTETLIIYAREVIGPGRKFVERVRALNPSRYKHGRGKFMLQIGDRSPFVLHAMEKGENQVEAMARAIEFYKWQDKRGLSYLEHYMHAVWYERKQFDESEEDDEF
jgi:hypothetical protein